MQSFKYLVWALLLIPTALIGLVGRILSPFACLFIDSAPYHTTVKRYGKQYKTLQRDRLKPWLSWFDTFDNAVDEYFYGMYDNTPNYTQEYYDTHIIYRWYCRVMWLQRNSMYGFLHSYVSIKPDSKLAWHYKGNVPIGFGYQMHINIGWKEHKESDVLMYAGRPVGKITKKE